MIDYKLLNLPPESGKINPNAKGVYVTDNATDFYRLVEYLMAFTVLGTAVEKIANFPISNLTVSSDSPLAEKKAKRIVKNIRLKDKLVKIGHNYFSYGRGIGKVMYAVRKTLICPECKTEYMLQDLHIQETPTYTYDPAKSSYSFSCENKMCPMHGKKMPFILEEREIKDPDLINIVVWNPNRINTVYNTMTDEKQFFYKPDANMIKKAEERNHFIISTTPEILLKAALSQGYVKLSTRDLFVIDWQGVDIGGTPIPPLMKAYNDALLYLKYKHANEVISDGMLIPISWIFPINKNETGRPITETINMSSLMDSIKEQIAKAKKKPGDPVIFPMEVGQRYLWAEGKMLISQDYLRANIQDILATIGFPIEFLYGGATWSRQNLASRTLENLMQSYVEKLDDIVDSVEEKINESMNSNEKISIDIELVQLVDEMESAQLLLPAKEKGEVSKTTYYNRFGLSYKNEIEKVKKEIKISEDVEKDVAQRMGILQVESQKPMMSLQGEQRDTERKEMLKDNIVNVAIQRDNAVVQAQGNAIMMDQDVSSRFRNLDKELYMMRAQLRLQSKENNDAGIDGLISQTKAQVQLIPENEKLMMSQAKTQAEGQKLMMRAQYELKSEMQQEQQQQEQRAIMQQTMESLNPQQKQQLSRMSDEEKQSFLMQTYEQQQKQEFYASLSEEDRAVVDNAPEDQKERKLSELMQKMQEEEAEKQAIANDPALLREKLKGKNSEVKTDEETIYNLALAYNRTTGEEKAKLVAEMQQESTERYALVKKLADEMAIDYYVRKLSEAQGDGSEEHLWSEISLRSPDLIDDIKQRLDVKAFIDQQAYGYAVTLLRSKDTPDQKILIDSINAQAPSEFREKIYSFYEELAKGRDMGQEIERKKQESVDNMAKGLMSLDDTSRMYILNQVRENDAVLYEKLKQAIGGPYDN